MSEKSTSTGWHWPVMIICLLLGSVGLNVVMMVISRNTPGFAVEERYYQKALKWDQTREQMAKNQALGWQLDLKLGQATSTPVRSVALTVLDKFKRPVPGAKVAVEAFHNAHSAKKIRATLSPSQLRYIAQLPIAQRGLWEFRFVVVKGQTQFTGAVRRVVR